MSTQLFRSGRTLTAAQLNRIIPEVGARAGEDAAEVIVRNGFGRRLEDFGVVDRSGASDMSALINTAIAACATAGDPLLIGPGVYLISDYVYLQSNAHVILSSRATLRRNMTSVGVLGMITNPDFATPLTGIVWRGGRIWNPDPATFAGNMLGLNCNDSEFSDFFIDEWSSLGRGFICHGDRNRLSNFRAESVNDGGGIRIERGDDTIVSNFYVTCGDDAVMVLSPATGLFAGGNRRRTLFLGGQVYSWNARCAVAAMQRVGIEDPIVGDVIDCAFIGIRGRGRMGLAVYNSLSSGQVGRILVSGCHFDCSGYTGASTSTGIDVYADPDPAFGGVADITVRDTTVLAPRDRTVWVRGTATAKFFNCYFDKPRTAQQTVEVEDASTSEFHECVIVGGAGAHPVQVGASGGNTTRTKFVNSEVRGIQDTYSGILVTSAAACELRGNRFLPASGSTTSRAIFVTAGNNVVLARNDVSAMPSATRVVWPVDVNTGCRIEDETETTISAALTLRSWNSGTTYILTGATGRTLTLPPAAQGLRFGFIQRGNGAITLQTDVAASDIIHIGASSSTAGGTAASGSVGAAVQLVGIYDAAAADSYWIARSHAGTWTLA